MKKHIIALIGSLFLANQLAYSAQQAENLQKVTQLEEFLNTRDFKEMADACMSFNHFRTESSKSCILGHMPHKEFFTDNCLSKLSNVKTDQIVPAIKACVQNLKQNIQTDLQNSPDKALSVDTNAPVEDTTQLENLEQIIRLENYLNTRDFKEMTEACMAISYYRDVLSISCMIKRLHSIASLQDSCIDRLTNVKLSQVIPAIKACVKNLKENVQDKLFDVSPLHKAASMGDVSLIRTLVEQNNNVDAQTTQGDTPLHYAARNNQRDAAEALLDAKAQPLIKNKAGKTAFDEAGPEVVNLLQTRIAGDF